MFDRFSDHARRSLSQARQEAQGLGHDAIGSEHMLLAVVAHDDCGAAKALRELGIDRDRVRSEVLRRVERGTREPSGQLPFTRNAKRVLEGALEEAKSRGNDRIGTEHLLLGFFHAKKSTAAAALTDLGLRIDVVHGKLDRIGPQ